MVEKRTIGINALITLGIVLSSMVIPGFFDEPKYYCESRPELGLMECEGFSKYVSENGKCLNPNGNKVCREGWLLVTKDFLFDAEPLLESEMVPVLEPKKVVPSGKDGKAYLCHAPASKGYTVK